MCYTINRPQCRDTLRTVIFILLSLLVKRKTTNFIGAEIKSAIY